tara:strand:+ start:100 stop:576 length:477 start_codon:yes stop_codon:yes gene_type:complete
MSIKDPPEIIEKTNWNKNIIILSGGFDPVHKGHIRMFREASWMGHQVIVGLNSDEWLTRKKGKPFMEFDERAEILQSCRFVNQVLSMNDFDDTASDIIVKVCKLYNNEDFNIYFANGGDRKKGNVPELATCNNLNVTMLWGIGGGKIQSSSTLIEQSK